MRGWSGRRDQVGKWGQRRVGGDEEAESRQQEAGRGDVEQSEARVRSERESEREKRRDRSDLSRTCSVGGGATPKQNVIT